MTSGKHAPISKPSKDSYIPLKESAVCVTFIGESLEL
jgi:hypothetical protein